MYSISFSSFKSKFSKTLLLMWLLIRLKL
uniref:Uncharacterized protein n=1 Tax=Rhizophora mucronata TaxID=61149 RepID=A0A2P2P1C1_RHIMU